MLRDIDATHGAVRLTELVRFTDPAEAAASLALRGGDPVALGFYLDRGRVHVGDEATCVDQVHTAWAADQAKGLDALMLAPTRALAADLNHRARTHRLTTHSGVDSWPGGGPPYEQPPETVATVMLADGNAASVGDLVITRRNDRRLRTTATDWVKNGDRWTITAVHPTGPPPGRDRPGRHTGAEVRVRHVRTGRSVRLPADYVATACELGYATTVHAAQGVSVDTVHGIAEGTEGRQQLYTMLTRGRAENHVYLRRSAVRRLIAGSTAGRSGRVPASSVVAARRSPPLTVWT